MPARLERTSVPGIFRRGGRYVVRYRLNGVQKTESARTLDEARRLKAARLADRDRGELHHGSHVSLHEYAQEWVERYQGKSRGFRENTRDEYRRVLRQYAFAYFPQRLKLSEVTPRHIAQFVGWLCDEQAQGRRLSDSTVRNIINPLRAMLATAIREGLVRSNPTAGVALPHRPRILENDEEEVRPFTREQLAAFLNVVNPRHRPLFEVLAATGLRISEALALQWRHVALDGDRPHIKVRRAYVRGTYGPPKSRHGRREVPHPVRAGEGATRPASSL